MDSPVQNKMAWPAPSDLEDFGPVAEPPQVQVRSVAPGRVVFDASTVFSNRTTSSTATKPESSSMPQTKQTTNNTLHTPLSSSMAMPGDQDLFIFREDDPSSTAANESTSVRNMFAAWNPPPDTYSFEIELPNFSARSHIALDRRVRRERLPVSGLARREQSYGRAHAYRPSNGNANRRSIWPRLRRRVRSPSSDVQRWQARQRERTLAAQATPANTPAFASVNELADDQGQDESMEGMATESVVVQPNYAQVTPFVAMTATAQLMNDCMQRLKT